MKTKIILSIFLAVILIIACKPASNKQKEGQESLALEKQESLTVEEQEYFDSLDAVIESYEEEEIVVVNKYEKIDKADESENMEGLIKIVDVRNVDDYSDAVENFIPDSMLVDSLRVIANTAETFIKWYINDSCPINQDMLFTFSETLGYYIFDSSYGDYYLKELQETGVVADSLIRSLRRRFVQSKTEMETMKLGAETDGVIGYEADIIFYSQDMPDPFRVKEMKLKDFDIYDNKISVWLGIAVVYLIYENGEWKVTSSW